MSNGVLVDALGMLAGGVWMSAAIYFQMVRRERVHPGFVAALTLIGVALMLASSAIALGGRTAAIQTAAIVGNGLFILLGVGAWYCIERYADLENRKDPDHTPTHE